MAISIVGGTEKQNAWASKIASDWLARLDAEIVNTTARPASDGVQWYADRLTVARTHLLASFCKLTAKQIIDLHTANRSPVPIIIATARKAAA